MALKAILFDFDGPIMYGQDKIQPDTEKMLTDLRKRGLIIGTMSGRTRGEVEGRYRRANLDIDSLHCVDDVGCRNKMGGTLVAAFCKAHDLQPHELLVIADDQTGMVEALNGRAFGFYATGKASFGFRVNSHAEILDYIDVFFLKKHLWYAKYTGKDLAGRPVILRCLIDGNGAGSAVVKSAIIDTLKNKIDKQLFGASFPKFLMMHLIASMYLDGFFSEDRKQFLWQIYPGHAPASNPPPVIAAAIAGFKIFRSKGESNHLTRWAAATQSSRARVEQRHNDVRFKNQMNSVKLAKRKVATDRKVNVIDDFCTAGYSLEAARNLFFAGGAKAVNVFAFGKYGSRYETQTPDVETEVLPYGEAAYGIAAFDSVTVECEIDEDALTEFLASLDRIRGSEIAGKLLD